MRICRVSAYALPFPFVGGGYTTSYGTRTHLDGVLLVLETEAGLTGYGEISRITGGSAKPTEPARLEAMTRALGGLIGADAAAPSLTVERLGTEAAEDRNLRCAVETACLDLIARAAGVPFSALLGGARRESVPTYASIGIGAPEAMANAAAAAQDQGYRVLQMKVGGDVVEDAARVAAIVSVLGPDGVLLPDANGGWSMAEAARVIRQFDDPRILWEEPCRSLAENRDLARNTGARLLLDQCLDSLADYTAMCAEGFAAGAGLKPTIQGGPNAARAARDLCIAHGVTLKVDDSWAADVGTAAALHLALGVPEPLLLCGVDMRLYLEERCDPNGPVFRVPDLFAPEGPGLGVTPDTAGLGTPLSVLE
jgi:L-alanine-DL-glutamate epimerase-like enolase superfamily enzyme